MVEMLSHCTDSYKLYPGDVFWGALENGGPVRFDSPPSFFEVPPALMLLLASVTPDRATNFTEYNMV